MNKTMKKVIKQIIAGVLTAAITVTTALAPVTKKAGAADSAQSGQKLYISDIRLGMGDTSDEAKQYLESEGYTILKYDDKLLDLNSGSTPQSWLAKGYPDYMVVYLGYKTTSDPNDAVTDIAVMNMKGGYSVEDYNVLLENYMDTKIKPFVDSFMATIKEYRENYNKPKNTINYKKASIVHDMLNKFTDDDTGGKPLGDLFLNETKYEMGDKAYNALSDDEKKNHVDAVTLFLQGNLTGISMVEKLLVKAADSSDDTWIDRYEETSFDKLMEEYEDKYPGADKSDIYKKMDKKYNDAAKKILEMWDDFAEIAESHEDVHDELMNQDEELGEKIDDLSGKETENMDIDEKVDYLHEFEDIQSDTVMMAETAIGVAVCDQMADKENDDGEFLEIFSKPSTEYKGDNIRKLYPLVASLSKGQIAGLDFVTLQELIDAGFNNVSNIEKDEYKDMEPCSIYEGVNRELYEKGAVGLTSDSLRLQANAEAERNSTTTISSRTIIMIGVTATLGISGFIAYGKYESFTTKAMNIFYESDFAMEEVLEREGSISEAVARSESITSGNGLQPSKYYKYAGIAKAVAIAFAVACVAMIIATVVSHFLDEMAVYETDFVPIPKYMVDEVDITRYNEKGEKEFYRNETAYYKAVECNRRSLNDAKYKELHKKRLDEVGDRGDLNGDVGKEWLALYTVKKSDSTPILADSLLPKVGDDSSNVPDGYKTGIHMFGEKNAYNLQNKKLLHNEPEAIRIYFKQDTEVNKKSDDDQDAKADDEADNKTGNKDAKLEDTGSIVSDSSNFMKLVLAFAAGGFTVWICTFIFGRRKKNEITK